MLAKSLEGYGRSIRAAVRAYWTGAIDSDQFADEMRNAINRGVNEAFDRGAATWGIKPDEYTLDEFAFIADKIDSELSHIAGFSSVIDLNSKANKGKLTPLLTRSDMWSNRYLDIMNQAKVMVGKDGKLEWVYGDTVHCPSCYALNGTVKRASFWLSSGVQPQNPPNDRLQCGGWRCRCQLLQTSKAVSKGPLPRL